MKYSSTLRMPKWAPLLNSVTTAECLLTTYLIRNVYFRPCSYESLHDVWIPPHSCMMHRHCSSLKWRENNVRWPICRKAFRFRFATKYFNPEEYNYAHFHTCNILPITGVWKSEKGVVSGRWAQMKFSNLFPTLQFLPWNWRIVEEECWKSESMVLKNRSHITKCGFNICQLWPSRRLPELENGGIWPQVIAKCEILRKSRKDRALGASLCL